MGEAGGARHRRARTPGTASSTSSSSRWSPGDVARGGVSVGEDDRAWSLGFEDARDPRASPAHHRPGVERAGDGRRRSSTRSARPSPPPTCSWSTTARRTAPPSVAKRAGARVLDLPINLGVGGAMRAGYKSRYRHGYDYTVQLDADGQHDPAEVRVLLETMVAEAARHRHRCAVRRRRRLQVRGPRRWTMSILSTVLSRVTGTRLTDTTSGFKACGRSADRALRVQLPRRVPGGHHRVARHRLARRAHRPAGGGAHAAPRRRTSVAQPRQGGGLPRPRPARAR